MPKQKGFLGAKRKKESKRKNEIPESENEYLAAGVDFEEAGEKWRAGDAAKALRFFIRAIETYDAGLKIFAQSFDLAYNKARLQYEVAQQPRLLEHLPTPLIDLLQVALDSHRIALQIQQDSPDLLFNTAQVLTSIAEATTGSRELSASQQDYCVSFLQEALGLFQRCLNLQEFKYNQAQENAAQASEPSTNVGAESTGPGGTGSNISEEEVWALIEEPITQSSLLDTAIAQLDTLTALCGLDASQGYSSLAWIEEYYRSSLQDKIHIYQGEGTRQEATLANAKFISAISDAAFRNGRLDLVTYERELAAAYTDPDSTLANNPQFLCDRADAELTFTTSLQASIVSAQSTELPQLATICWKHIAKALDSLTAASKVPHALNLPRINLRRGDCEMLRLRLSEAPFNYDLAIKSMPTLLKNAEVYYRGAGALARRSKDDEGELKDAKIKEAVAVALGGDYQRLATAVNDRRDYLEATLEEMRDENLLGDESLRRIERLYV